MKNRKLKQILCTFLAVLMLMGVLPLMSASAEDLPAKAYGYNRYYFYMPESWYNEYATDAYIYWWEGADACGSWPGYNAFKTDIPGVYYYDVYSDVTTIIWSNGVDGYQLGSYEYAYQTKNIGSEYYDVDESPNYPYGTVNFDEMIYVIDESKTEINNYSGKSTFVGEWFYYYGNGEYGLTPEKGSVYFNSRSYYNEPKLEIDSTDIAEDTSGIAFNDEKLYFEVPEAWNNYSRVYCHIWEFGGDSLAAWQSRKEQCEQVENRLYSYDPSTVGGLEEGKTYGIIFSTDLGTQTYDSLMTTDCYGDTLYCDGTIYENPYDYNKTCIAAFWKNQDRTVLGPIKQITSIGNVIGESYAPGENGETLFKDFLKNDLDNARLYSNKTDQEIIDALIEALDLDVNKVLFIILESGVSVDWNNGGQVTTALTEPVEPTETFATEETEPTETPTYVPETEPEWSFDDLPEVGYNRYYFYMPESWYNEYATYPCIYWWEGTNACGAWPGHKAFKTDIPGVYYYDVHSDVTTIIWNNGIDGGTDDTQTIYTLAYQTKNIGSEYYDVEESPNYPYGTDTFDKMIYVIDESKTEINDYSGKSTYAGEWYYYYGNGEYGLTPEKGEVYFTDRTYFENPTPVYNDSSEETTVPFEEGMARIYCGDKYYDVNVGDTVTYTVNLKTPNKIEQIIGYFEYGNELKVISDSSSWYPNISTMDTGTIMYFNASDIAKGFDFTEEKVLLNVSFTVVKEGEIRLNLCIEGMVEFFGGDYVLDGEILDDGVCLNESLTVTAAEETIPETTAPKDLLLGDADLDKAVKIKDATAIQKHSANMISLSEDGLLCADVTADGKVNVKDATAIQKFLANIDTGYDINTYISGGSSGNDNPDYEEPEITDDIPDTDKPALSSKLYFKIPSDWKNFSTIYCHIYDEDGNALSNWHSKKEKCTQENGSIYSFDSTRVGELEAGVTYFVVVSSDIGSESEHIELTDSSFENPIILTTEQDSVIVEPEIPDDNNDTISYCDICYDSVSSPYYYDGYQLCYDCYYDMKYDTTSYCDICNDSVSSPYYYDGYELCYSCYYDMKYDSSSSCDNCGKSVTDTYSYGGQKLCYSCYNLISNSVMCDMCRKFVSVTYKHNGHDLCYDCYYERAYDNCDNCGAAVSDPQYYNGYKLCYSCYNNMKNHSCDECGKYVSSPYSYNGQSLCYSCYTDMIPHYEKCSICHSPSVYQSVVNAWSGGVTYYCYSCYYNRY